MKTVRQYKTSKGTELPISDIRGKEYLEVKFRIVWFREDHPDWSIETEMMSVTQDSAYAKATIRDQNGRTIATSHKFENAQGFPDFIEKSETGAIGRALALIGYGTQFCADELDEGNRIVDSGIAPKGFVEHFKDAAEAASKFKKEESDERIANDIGEYAIKFGKHSGKKLKSINPQDLMNYMSWIEKNSKSDNKPLSPLAAEFIQFADAYLKENR